ncbi:MAG TPA: DUF2027 domain-containing protein [Bacteroidales bacterium]|mgnify:CR=1 FL=1|nr:DUF2027 domain-containing protein [Bacteroidales bacterium]
MKFKVGDKVKFLNEKGGGIVSKIISNSMVNVASDGFELPVMVNELLLVTNDNAAERFFDEQKATEHTIYNIPTEEKTPAEIIKPRPFDISSGIHIAFVPLDQRLLIAGDIEIFLINNTAFDVIYTLFLKDSEGFTGIDYGSIGAYSKSNIQLADREQMEYYTNGVIQILYFSDFVEKIITPVSQEFRFKPVKLLKEDNYIVNTIFNKRSFIYKICEAPVTEDKNAEAPAQNKIPEAQLKRDSLIQKHRIEDGFAEVDLHIEALCEEYLSLGNHEKLQIQLDYFSRCLENAIAENYKRVIFIHGVGVGILKLEITKILEQYPFLEYFDASIAKYGIGATEVLIHKEK